LRDRGKCGGRGGKGKGGVEYFVLHPIPACLKILRSPKVQSVNLKENEMTKFIKLKDLDGKEIIFNTSCIVRVDRALQEKTRLTFNWHMIPDDNETQRWDMLVVSDRFEDIVKKLNPL
jgi:hypothetical protein